jgi:hypothetical protein
MYQILTTKCEIKETGETITLKAAQKAVGGYVQSIRLRTKSPKFMLVDEDARMKAPCPELNPKATSMVGMPIFGNVVLLDKMSDLKG